MSDTPTQKWLSTIPSQNRISWKAGNRIPGKYGSSRQTNASRSNTATGLSPLLVGHTRHPAVFLKAQLVLFLAKASPYGSCGIQNETRILENTQFALIDFFRDSQHHPLRSRVCNLQVANRKSWGLPPFLPPLCPVSDSMPSRGAIWAHSTLVGATGSAQESNFPKEANNDLKMTKHGFL